MRNCLKGRCKYMIIELLLIYIVYLILVIVGTYYVTLFIKQENYSRDDFKKVSPWFSMVWSKLTIHSPLPIFFIVLIVSSLLGIMIPIVIKHWITSSTIIFAAIFLLLPLLKNNISKTMVSSSAEYSDNAMNMLVRYSDIIIFGFGLGTATMLLYNWGSQKLISFLWFLPNFIVISILLGIQLKKYLDRQQ